MNNKDKKLFLNTKLETKDKTVVTDSIFSFYFLLQGIILIIIAITSAYLIKGRTFTYSNNVKIANKNHANSQICHLFNEFPEKVHVFYKGAVAGERHIYIFSLMPDGNNRVDTVPGTIFYVFKQITDAKKPKMDTKLLEFTINRQEVDYFLHEGPDAPRSTRTPAAVADSLEGQSEGPWQEVPGLSDAGRTHPNVIYTPTSAPQNTYVTVKFRSLSTRFLELWYDDGSGKRNTLGVIPPDGSEVTSWNCHVGGKVYVTEAGNTNLAFVQLVLTKEQFLYVIYDEEEHSANASDIMKTVKEQKFLKEYMRKTGIPWINNFRHFPTVNNKLATSSRDIIKNQLRHPQLFMYYTARIGQRFAVRSQAAFWMDADRKSAAPVDLVLEVISGAPRILICDDFLSSFEVDVFMGLIKFWNKEHHLPLMSKKTTQIYVIPKELPSHVYGQPVIDSIIHRLQDALNITSQDEKMRHALYEKYFDEFQLVRRSSSNQNIETHHDFHNEIGTPDNRFITIRLFMSGNTDGGELHFPKAQGEYSGLRIIPKKGMLVISYNLLPDGNGDDFSLYDDMVVKSGEQWFVNLWVWERYDKSLPPV